MREHPARSQGKHTGVGSLLGAVGSTQGNTLPEAMGSTPTRSHGSIYLSHAVCVCAVCGILTWARSLCPLTQQA